MEERTSSGASLRLSVSVPEQAPRSPSARLVVPETLPVIASWKVSLTRAVGDPVISLHEAGGASIAVSDIDPGTWDILVEGFSESAGAGTCLARGSYPGAVLGSGDTASISVSARYVDSGTGGFSFRLTFPSEAADTVRYSFNSAVYVPDVLMAAGQSSVLLSASDITPGTYPLGVELVKNGGVVRRLAESVVIVPNVVSTRWLSSSGLLGEVRSLDATDFADDEASLVSVAFTGGNLDATFNQSTFNYKLQNLSARSIAVTAITSTDKQSITLFVNGILKGTLRSGQMSAPFEAPHGADILLTVTAADGVTANVYSFTVERTHVVTFDHQAIESSTRKITYESIPHGTPVTMKEPDVEKVQDGIKLAFRGWCKDKNGTGAILAHPTQVTITEPTTYYGIWSVIGGTGPAGGTVFYDKIVDNPSNPYADGWRYMEMKSSDDNGLAIYSWLDNNDYTLCLTSDGIGQGLQNYHKTLAQYGTYASLFYYVFVGYVINGYSDWFIPSRKEFDAARSTFPETGGSGYYWTSTEYDAEKVVCINSDGLVQTILKNNPDSTDVSVRPVRMFANDAKTASVFFAPNGATAGTAPTYTSLFKSGTSFIMPGAGDMSKDLCTFAGWQDINDTEYAVGDTVVLNGHMVYRAIWIVAFDAIGRDILVDYESSMNTHDVRNYAPDQLESGTAILYVTDAGNVGKILFERNLPSDVIKFRYCTYNSDGTQLKEGSAQLNSGQTIDLDTGVKDVASGNDLTNLVSGSFKTLSPTNGAKFYKVP